MIKVLHNNSCSKSRGILEFLDENNVPFEIIDLVENPLTHTILTYFNDIPYRELLEQIESEVLQWSDKIDLEQEFVGAQRILQQTQRNQRKAELHSKSLSQLTDEEKRELQQLTSL